MKASVLHKQAADDTSPLNIADVLDPTPADDELSERVPACAICRTDLHVVKGELLARRAPVTPEHQVVGREVATGARVEGFTAGQRVGVA